MVNATMLKFFISALFIGAFVFSACDKQGTTPVKKNADGTVTQLSQAEAEMEEAEELPKEEAMLKNIVFNFSKGDEYHYKITQFSSLSDSSTKVESENTFYYTKTIKNVRDGGLFEIGIRYDSITRKESFTAPGKNEKRTYNSSNPNDKKDKKYFADNALIGEEATIMMDKKGKIEEVSGFTPVVNKMFDAVKDSIPAQYHEKYKEQIMMQVRSLAYVSVVSLEQQRFPDKELDSTQSWKLSDNVPLNQFFGSSLVASYKIQNVKKIEGSKVAEVSGALKGTIIKDARAKDFKIDLGKSNISGQSKAIINADKGATIFREAKINTLLNVNVIAPNGQSQKVRQNMVNSQKVELIK